MSDAQQRWEPHIRPSAAPPQAFLSYAWEGDPHSTWVFNLAKRLQEKSGVRIVLDQCDLPPGSDRLAFMERSVESSDFVILICTPTYAEKANVRDGGVGYEAMVITGALAKQIETRKFIPVLRSGDWDSSLPTYIRSKHGVDLQGDPYSETQYEQLIRALHGEPLKLPPVGPRPAFSSTLAQLPAPTGKPVESLKLATRDPRPNCLPFLPWGDGDPGPCIDVVVMNSREVIEAGRSVGLHYPEPVKMKALLDTGAAITVISKTFAKYCKLMQTGETEIRALGSLHKCGEYAGAISFPGMDLRPYDPIRLVSADFVQERHYAVLIGRDILRNWTTTFDGRHKRVTIVD